LNEQLIFKLSRRQAYNREDFFVSKTNSLAVKILENWKNFSSSGLVIVGPSACGKTHLAAVWSKETSAKSYDISTFFGIDLNHLIDEKFIVLEDVEKLELIPKDKRLIIEENILHTFNSLSANNGKILFTSCKFPRFWEIGLKDLLSRIMTLTIIELNMPDDNLLAAVMAKQFQDRQIKVDDEVLTYAISRMERSFLFAKTLVEALDVESLKLKKPIKKNMVNEIIEKLYSRT
jgi:chromosomal replication initiation ATPase DnaA